MHEIDKIVELKKFEGYSVGLRKDGIAHIFIEDETEIESDLQQNIAGALKYFKGDGEKIPVIIELGNFLNISEKAISHEQLSFKETVKSIAVYAKNMADRIIANYYTKKYKTSSTFIVFNDFDKAVAYSLEQKNKKD